MTLSESENTAHAWETMNAIRVHARHAIVRTLLRTYVLARTCMCLSWKCRDPAQHPVHPIHLRPCGSNRSNGFDYGLIIISISGMGRSAWQSRACCCPLPPAGSIPSRACHPGESAKWTADVGRVGLVAPRPAFRSPCSRRRRDPHAPSRSFLHASIQNLRRVRPAAAPRGRAEGQRGRGGNSSTRATRLFGLHTVKPSVRTLFRHSSLQEPRERPPPTRSAWWKDRGLPGRQGRTGHMHHLHIMKG